MSDAAIVSFMLGHEQEMRELIRTRLVQTNEVRRCALLLPAFVTVAREVERPLALVEVGSSAGLLLNFDRYRYVYRPGGEVGWGDALELTCEVRGDVMPPLDTRPLSVTSRVGIDLNPIRVEVEADVKWLRALIWPEHQERQDRLEAALAVAAGHPPDVRRGDAFDLLPELVAGIPGDVTPVVFHCMTLAHMAPPRREAFAAMASELAADSGGDLNWIAAEGDGVHLTTFAADGAPSTEALAKMNPHGAWLEWLAS